MNKKNKIKNYIVNSLITLIGLITSYFIYSISLLAGIENFIRIIIAFILIIILFSFIFFKKSIRKKTPIFISFIITTIIYIILLLFLAFNINQIYNKLTKVSKVSTVHSTSLVTDINNKINTIEELDNGSIGVLNDKTSIEGYEIAQEIIKTKKLKNKIIYFDNYIELIENLKSNEVKYIFLPTNYKILFSNMENLNDYLDHTKIIHTENKEILVQRENRKNSITKPITILLMGVDSEVEGIANSSFNGDALMVLTFNPKTLKTTMVSVPRDSYVPIACFPGQRKNKITHAAWYGENCMMKTIENLFDIKIDYFFKINFKGVVKLVDKLGGIEVDVPYQFCEQDSNRKWGSNTIYVRKGVQNLNGEQALALTRNRKNNASRCGIEWGYGGASDLVRGQNQQLVLKGILNKFKNIKKIDTIYNLLDILSNNMETNMSVNEILSFYNIGKDILSKTKKEKIDDIIKIQKLVLKTYGQYIMDYSEIHNQGMKRELSNQVPYKGSIKDVSNAMKINLGLRDAEIIKTLKFNINEPYQEILIGNSYYNEASIPLLPNFLNSDVEKARTFANNNNLKLTIDYVSSTDSSYKIGQIINQKPFAKMDMDYVRTLTIEVVNELNIKPIEPIIPNCSLEENKDDELCKLPDFVGKDITYYNQFIKKHNLSIVFEQEQILATDPEYNFDLAGLIASQNQEKGISLFDLIGETVLVKFYEIIEEEPLEEEEEEIDSNLVEIIE